MAWYLKQQLMEFNDMENQDIKYVRKRKVACDGGNGALGHPKVFLEIKKDKIVCPYCSKTFVYESDKAAK